MTTFKFTPTTSEKYTQLKDLATTFLSKLYGIQFDNVDAFVYRIVSILAKKDLFAIHTPYVSWQIKRLVAGQRTYYEITRCFPQFGKSWHSFTTSTDAIIFAATIFEYIDRHEINEEFLAFDLEGQP